MDNESVGAQLRNLRRRIDAQGANPHTWSGKEDQLAADLDRYDRRLVKAAVMLGVDAPSGHGREGFVLDETDRRQLEERLMKAGLDLWAAVQEESEA